MFKRILLALTFVAALSAAGLGMSSKANAWHHCHGDYGYAYPTYYPNYYSYGYAPRVSYYQDYGYPAVYRNYGYYGNYGHRHHHHHHGHHHGHGGVRVSFGF